MKLWMTSILLIMVCIGGLNFYQLQPLSAAERSAAKYEGAGKILIPHKSWQCGMAEGIPVPERGVPVFEANMKLDQIYDMGKTPYGQRQVFVIQGGTISGEKINGSVMSGGLDFQLSFSKFGGREWRLNHYSISTMALIMPSR
jgi:hypothetical protein